VKIGIAVNALGQLVVHRPVEMRSHFARSYWGDQCVDRDHAAISGREAWSQAKVMEQNISRVLPGHLAEPPQRPSLL
jgi:hypothetical protein